MKFTAGEEVLKTRTQNFHLNQQIIILTEKALKKQRQKNVKIFLLEGYLALMFLFQITTTIFAIF
jgi:hypothetical protein